MPILICDFTPKVNVGIGIVAPEMAAGFGSGTQPPGHWRLSANWERESSSKLVRSLSPPAAVEYGHLLVILKK